MDIVIPLGSGSRFNNNELRFCLRSIEKHLTGVDNIHIIGYLPSFVTNVGHTHVYDLPEFKRKEYNIYKKIVTACEKAVISGDFLFMNDDHFILQDMDAKYFPLHHNGRLLNVLNLRGIEDPYRQTIKNTIRYFEMAGADIDVVHHYDIHSPIVLNKACFLNAFDGMRWRDWGYLIKTMYCLNNGLSGKFFTDLKINMPFSDVEILRLIKGRPYFSMGDRARGGDIWKVLSNLYPHKSKYEK